MAAPSVQRATPCVSQHPRPPKYRRRKRKGNRSAECTWPSLAKGNSCPGAKEMRNDVAIYFKYIFRMALAMNINECLKRQQKETERYVHVMPFIWKVISCHLSSLPPKSSKVSTSLSSQDDPNAPHIAQLVVTALQHLERSRDPTCPNHSLVGHCDSLRLRHHVVRRACLGPKKEPQELQDPMHVMRYIVAS